MEIETPDVVELHTKDLISLEKYKYFININKMTTTLKKYVFKNSACRYVVMNNVKIIEHGAFFESVFLTSVNNAKNVEMFGSSCFEGCINLEHVEFGKSGFSIKEDAFSRTNLRYVDLSGMLDVDVYAFYNTPIRSVILPNKDIVLKENSFGKTNFRTIVIPNNIQRFEENVLQ